MSVGSSASQVWLKRVPEELQVNVRASHSYPLEEAEALQLGQPGLFTASFRAMLYLVNQEEAWNQQSALVISGKFSQILLEYLAGQENLQQTAVTLYAGLHKTLIISAGDYLEDGFSQLGSTVTYGKHHRVVVAITNAPIEEYSQASCTLFGGVFNAL